MKLPIAAGLILSGLPLLAAAQTPPDANAQAIAARQQEMERQLKEQAARIEQLEKILRQVAPAAVAAAPAPVAAAAATPATAAPAAVAAAATERKPADNPGPDYVSNLGFKLYESDKGQIYMRLMSYVRYLNQKGLDATYTDYFGNTKTVARREDVQLNKFFLPFAGWFLDERFRYYLYVWSANTAQGEGAQTVGAGNLSFVANSHVTIGAGITSLPSVRSTEGQFPYWLGVDDRLISDEFFRGSYTTGFWLKGAIVPGVNYNAMIGNNLSTLGISAAQLDNKLDTYSVMLNWLPTTKEFGPLGAFGDFEGHFDLATRIGVHYTHSTEDRQSQPGSEAIDNTQIRLTDGSVIFTPNLFGAGVTIEKLDYDMASLDAGLKYRGMSLEAEYYWRTLSQFRGSNTAGIADIKDDGFQVQASAMLIPKLFQVYMGASQIYGHYGDASELRAGFNYFPKRSRGLRLNGEWINLNDSPVGYTAVPYPVGGNGDVFHLNFELNF